MTASRTAGGSFLFGRLLARGESIIAPVGLALVGIVVTAIGLSSVLVLRTHRQSLQTVRVEQLRAVGNLVAWTAENMFGQDDLSAVRRLMAQVGQQYKLDHCRIVLPDGQVIADSDPGRVTLSKLPERWTGAAEEPTERSLADDRLMLRRPLRIPRRGAACLEIGGLVGYPPWHGWEAATTVCGIGGAALGVFLLIYRRMRVRFRGIGTIREALLAFGRGQTGPAAMAVDAGCGAETRAWNQFLMETDRLRRQVLLDQANESSGRRLQQTDDLSAACDALAQGMILVGERLQVHYANGAAGVFLQVKRDELIGADVSRAIREPEVLAAIRDAQDAGGFQRRMVEVQRSDQANGLLRFIVRPCRGNDSAMAMVIIEDVTQQRVAESARTAFVVQATHELRTPLTNIRLQVETALDEGESDGEVRGRCLNAINQEVTRLDRMVGDILSMAEIEAGMLKLKRDDVPLEALLEDLRVNHEAQARAKRIKLAFNLPPKLPTFVGDRDKLAIALQNLLGNALKYTPEGGRVTVAVEADAARLTVEVKDTGIGISPADAERIFEKFYRAKDPRVGKIVGSGLGLALTREVVRLHGGEVTVESELDRGSTFVLSLPLSGGEQGDEDPGATQRRRRGDPA